MIRPWTRLGRLGVGRGVAIGATVAIVAAAVGVASAGDPVLGLLLAVVVLIVGLVVTDPLLLIVLSAAATLLMQRVGGALSVSDAALAVATLLALFLVSGRELRSMSAVLWAGTAYLAAIIPTLVLNPYAANAVEWAHDLMLVLGSLVVGFVIGRSGRTQVAVGVYVLACVVIGAAAAVAGVVMLATQHRFGPVYLPDLDKNLIGCALVAAIIIVYGRPAWFRLPARWRWTAIAVMGVGVVAAGSRQAFVGLAVGLIVIALRRHPETGKRPKLPWISFVLIIYAVVGLVLDQLSSGDQFNSAAQRLDWYDESVTVWLTSPVFGVGLRWWYTQRFAVAFQPPNLELEQLTTVGVVGLLALLALFAVAVVALWRLDPWYGTVGAAVVVARFAESQFDLYWVAGQASFLWIVTGICFGAVVHARASGSDVEGLAAVAPLRTRPRAPSSARPAPAAR